MEYPHIFLTGQPVASKYSSKGRPNKGPKLPVRDRNLHSKKLLNEYNQLWKTNGDSKMPSGV